MLSQGQQKQVPEGPASEKLPAVDKSGAADGPQHGGLSGTPLAPQLANLGGGSPHPGGGGS